MVSGSDEHGTPITVAAETQGVSPQSIVDKYHQINKSALIQLGCSWEPNIDPRGVEYGVHFSIALVILNITKLFQKISCHYWMLTFSKEKSCNNITN